MTPDKAIDGLKGLLIDNLCFDPLYRRDALKLGIEALKNLQRARSLVSRSSYKLLPGETEE